MTGPFWGDLHNHNAIGYGKGSLERSYRIAEGSGLDVYAFTPHGNWKDMDTAGDETLLARHQEGYEKVRDAWPMVQGMAEQRYRPGSFVTFAAFESHSSRFGDYHVLLPGNDHVIFDPDTPDALRDYCLREGALMIPHHLAYPKGWRGCDWSSLHTDVSPVVCVFSEHGDGFDPDSAWRYTGHSMGGADWRQCARRHLQQGLRAGFIASTDNHFGHPASYGEGLAGIWAETLDRSSVLDAIRRRHVYAVSGDRIILKTEMAGAMMGDILPAETDRTLRFEVTGQAPLTCIQVLKNGDIAETFGPPPKGSNPKTNEVVFRLEFGWDTIGVDALTEWDIRLDLDGAELLEAIPCFRGGAGSSELVNELIEISEHHFRLRAFTSRRNTGPTSEIVVRARGKANSVVRVEATTRRDSTPGGATLRSSLGDLSDSDSWARISDTFSAPKLRLARAHPAADFQRNGVWTDPTPGPNDSYMLKVSQANGHLAYSSPIWTTSEKELSR